MSDYQKKYTDPYHESHRLRDHDYRDPGWYYVTICTAWHIWQFGTVVDDQVQLSEAGSIVQDLWATLPQRFPGISLDEYIVMPNHLHGILILPESYPPEAWIEKKRWRRPSVGMILRAFKASATHRIHHITLKSDFQWQPNYHDHITRNNADLERIRLYIVNNPAQWAEDEYYKSLERKGKSQRHR